MAITTLVSWLLTESLGAFMLRGWIASGGLRRRGARPDRISLPVVFGHAGLAATGLTCWVIFLGTGWVVAAWLAIVFLAPAIGLGISTVTVWTPYPSPRATGVEQAVRSVPVSDAVLARALADEELTGRLVEDMLMSALAADPAPPRGGPWRAVALVPAVHGVLAIVTILLAMLTAVGAVM